MNGRDHVAPTPKDGVPSLLSAAEAEVLLGPFFNNRSSRGVVLAVSGGPDSVALMRLAAALPARLEAASMTVATVDHGLRSEARGEAETVAGWAESCGLPHRILTWHGDKPAAGLQAAAREARYGLLAELARTTGASHLLTAHHRDDQAETVLLRLLKGSGIGGLVGMRSETDLAGVVLARPFLEIPKARLVATCEAQNWPFLQDSSNADPAFTRTRLRRLMPLLEAEGLTPERLLRLARRAGRWEEVVERAADRAFAAALVSREPARLVLDGAKLLGEPEETVLRVLSRGLETVVEEHRTIALDTLENLTLAFAGHLRSGGAMRFNLGGALLALAADRRVTITPEPPRRHAPHLRPQRTVPGAARSLGMEGRRA